ncbi:MAG: hypothetical protein ABUM51_07445, partial [Bacteroidota bacterium]
ALYSSMTWEDPASASRGAAAGSYEGASVDWATEGAGAGAFAVMVSRDADSLVAGVPLPAGSVT